MPLQRFFDDHESDVRSAELCRNSPSLSLADTNLETVFPGRRYDPQRCRLRDDGDLDRAIRHRADGVIVFEHAEKVRRLNGNGEHVGSARPLQRLQIDSALLRPAHFHDLVSEVLNVSSDGGGVLRMHRPGNDHLRAILHHPIREQHGLAQRGRAVVERRVGHIEAGEHALMRLVFEDRLQCSLRNLGLIRRVRGQKLGAEQQLIDARRLVVRVRAPAEKRQMIGGGLVARGQFTEPASRLDLRPWPGDVQHAIELHVARNRFEESIDRIDSDDAEHLAHVF